MGTKKVGLGLFWVGVIYMISASWLAMWWIATIWRDTPADQFTGTIWAFSGPVFMTIALSMPLGIFLTVVGIYLHSRSTEAKTWPFLIFVVGGVLISLSMLFPATSSYYPVLFGIAGGLIYLFFFAAIWYWGKNHKHSEVRQEQWLIFS